MSEQVKGNYHVERSDFRTKSFWDGTELRFDQLGFITEAQPLDMASRYELGAAAQSHQDG